MFGKRHGSHSGGRHCGGPGDGGQGGGRFGHGGRGDGGRGRGRGGQGGGGQGGGGPQRGRGVGAERGLRGGAAAFGTGGRRRVFAPGDLRLVLLSLIEEKPRHGYELIKELEQKFGGAYAPSPGSVYPNLTLLEELGQVRASATGGSRRLFEITPEGSAWLRENEAALESALSRMDIAARAVYGEAPPAELRHAMHTLRTALMFHRGDWDAQETERVRRLIEDAAEAISRKP